MKSRMKIPKRQTFSKVMRDYVSPTMAILGWLLLIIFYVMMIRGDGGEENRSPVIHGIQVTPKTVETGQTASVQVFASDPDGDEIHYIWGSASHRIQLDRFQDDQCTYVAPDLPGTDVITIIAYDGKGAEAKGFEIITIVEGGTD